MSRMSIIVQRDVLKDTISGIGHIGKVQFIDLNEGVVAFSRPFTEDIRLCDELLRKMRLLEDEMLQEPSLEESIAADINMGCSTSEMRHSAEAFELDLIAERIDEKLTNVQAMVTNLKSFRRELNNDHELWLLHHILTEQERGTATSSAYSGLTPSPPGSGVFAPARDGDTHAYLEGLRRLHNIAGAIKAGQAEDLRRLCYRVTRGNAVVMVSEPHLFYDPETGERTVSRCLFTIFGSSRIMMDRLRKLIESLGATLHSLDDIIDRGVELQQHVSPIAAAAPVLEGNSDQLTPDHPSQGAGASSLVAAIQHISRQKAELLAQWYSEHRIYKTYLRVEKAVLLAMNACLVAGQTATLSLWIPSKYIPVLESVLEDAVISSAGDVRSVMTLHPSQRHPPTYFETNWFTATFQGIVDSYGMARYKEVNPGVFTIVTFPYLFGMMYGDMGHGILLLGISLYFIYKGRHWREESLNEMVQMLFGGRYLLLLMSLFAIYMGVLYNDFMGFSLNLFHSGYQWGPLSASEEGKVVVPVSPNGAPSVKPRSTYPVGLDAAWSETENKLEFYNSVKMKCAVIVGVVQMFAGLFLSLNNYIYHKQWVRIYYLFIPEFVFLLCTFGYMCILIIVKWCKTWDNTHLAPSLLEVMTNFFLQPGAVAQPLFAGQAAIQVVLLLIAFSMVPIMLCAMPLHDYRRYQTWLRRSINRGGVEDVTVINSVEGIEGQSVPNAERGSREEEHSAGGSLLGDGAGGDSASFPPSPADALLYDFTEEEEEEFEHFDLSELIIHYVIHTIEYVLSTVSNTASYLRLWALSLAHAQLSEVFFNFAVVKMLDVDTSGIAVGMGVLIWLGVTMGVLVGMEALSSFLHALRLHWVEFNNKFYSGDGRAFEPFDLRTL